MLEDFLRVYTLARMEAHNLIKQIDEVCIADPFVTTVSIAFLED